MAAWCIVKRYGFSVSTVLKSDSVSAKIQMHVQTLNVWCGFRCQYMCSAQYMCYFFHYFLPLPFFTKRDNKQQLFAQVWVKKLCRESKKFFWNWPPQGKFGNWQIYIIYFFQRENCIIITLLDVWCEWVTAEYLSQVEMATGNECLWGKGQGPPPRLHRSKTAGGIAGKATAGRWAIMGCLSLR